MTNFLFCNPDIHQERFVFGDYVLTTDGRELILLCYHFFSPIVQVFRIYYVAQLIAVADLQNWMKEILASCSRKAHTYDLKEQQPPPELPILEATFIPTGGVGHSAAVNALVAMDFTAMGSSSRSSEHL